MATPTPRVALETTILVHGVPRGEGMGLARRLSEEVRKSGARACVVGVVGGVAKAEFSEGELRTLLEAAAKDPASVPKLNTSNLGVAMARRSHGATTVATTMEIASGAGIRVFATGGLGGVHPQARGSGAAAGGFHFDVSADLAALTRFPMVVVASGVKSILDVAATREVLETLGVPVIGFGTDEFPCFYLQKHPTERVNACDARFDDVGELARYARREIMRTGRSVLVCNPIPAEHEIKAADWTRWLKEAEVKASASGAAGRDATPRVLAALHEVSGGATLRANVELAVSNAGLAGRIAAAM